MSSVNSVDNSSTASSDTSSRIPSKTMTQADFLKVLVAQYSNQLPTDSQSSTDIYKNMMDMSNYQAIQGVSTTVSAQAASQMVGKYVTAKNSTDGTTSTGTISAVSFDGTDWTYKVGDASYKPTQITLVTTAPTTTTTTTSN